MVSRPAQSLKMLGAYLSSLLLFLQLAHAVTNSSSSVSYSTSTLQITSFLTVTAPRPTGSGNALSNATGLEQASSCNQAKLDWIEDRGARTPIRFHPSVELTRSSRPDIRVELNLSNVNQLREVGSPSTGPGSSLTPPALLSFARDGSRPMALLRSMRCVIATHA